MHYRPRARRGMLIVGSKCFARRRFACLSCHQVGKNGGAIGPALTDVGRRLKPEEIAEAVLWPKHSVKPEFRSWQILLADGRSLQGYKRSESAAEVQLFDPTNQQTYTLAKDEIEAQREVGTLMPDGLAAAMTDPQRRHVLRLLLELGVTPRLENEVLPEPPPAEFLYDRAPLDRAASPNWQQPVNRDRIYDFYLKEALFFRHQSPRPHLLPAFPGLDGGTLGHWGNQNEEVWKDGRWNETDLGTVLCGVFHGPSRRGAQGRLRATWRARRDGGLLQSRNAHLRCALARRLSRILRRAARLLGWIASRGRNVATPMPVYRRKNRSSITASIAWGRGWSSAYRIGDVEMLDSPWVKDGKFERIVAPAAEHPLRDALQAAPPQWPQEL